ncbi:MAG: phytanoyl-CoA dioxygenase [Planctomycetota bacterium]|nr:MAG: phytanoyl-CoA dioxygenase [Planctomycetota bacterium]
MEAIMPPVDEQQLLLQMQINGYCILEDIIPQDECAVMRELVSAAVERERSGYPGAPRNVGFVPSLVNHDQSFVEYLAAPRLMGLLGKLLGEHLRISFTSAIINEPANERGKWHADWPFNQNNAGRVLAPYPDALMHITTLWMLSSFREENGGTLVLPGSHRCSTNPTAEDGPDPFERFPAETNASGDPGSVLVMDSRLWHATAPNRSSQPRVALAVRYAPWWLNLEVLRPESDERRRMCDESGRSDNIVPSIRPEVYASLPENVQPLYRHWVARD